MTEFEYWNHIKLLLDCEQRIAELASPTQWLHGRYDLFVPWSKRLRALEDFPRMELSPENKYDSQ